MGVPPTTKQPVTRAATTRRRAARLIQINANDPSFHRLTAKRNQCFFGQDGPRLNDLITGLDKGPVAGVAFQGGPIRSVPRPQKG
jgi:hypothetical protein